jgi:hypothetical protein
MLENLPSLIEARAAISSTRWSRLVAAVAASILRIADRVVRSAALVPAPVELQEIRGRGQPIAEFRSTTPTTGGDREAVVKITSIGTIPKTLSTQKCWSIPMSVSSRARCTRCTDLKQQEHFSCA